MKLIIVAALICLSFLVAGGSNSSAQTFPTLAQDQELNRLFTGLLDARSQIPAVSSMPVTDGSFPLGSVGQVSYSGPGINTNPSSLFGSEGGPLFAVSGQQFTTSLSMPTVSTGGLGLLWPGTGQQTQGLGVPGFTSLNTQALTGPQSMFNLDLNSMYMYQPPVSPGLWDLPIPFYPAGSSVPIHFSGGSMAGVESNPAFPYFGAAGSGASQLLPTLPSFTLPLSATVSVPPTPPAAPSTGGGPVSGSSSWMPSDAEFAAGGKYFGMTPEQAKQYWLTHSE